MGLKEARAYKRSIDQTDDEAKDLRNKVSRLGIEVKELEIQAARLEQAKREEEELGEQAEEENRRLRADLNGANVQINQLLKEKEELRAENVDLKRRLNELLIEASKNEARKALGPQQSKGE